MKMEQLQIYHVGFYICLALAVLGAVLALILFFTLRIRDAWRMNFAGAKSFSRTEHFQRRKGTGSASQADHAAEAIPFAQADCATEVIHFDRTEMILSGHTEKKRGD
ncbi:MAG: hypothetical protein LUC60_04210 [Lachnospiraceae bacterium]|nr:hypothetical protein [Lachnospiraceae bacterium]